ncbi:XrtA system polysaccharide deacetylase [Sphingomonas arantia]|uniref:Chitooligosaccharide deacetylase n=1 Tax=Sphingomonas arantia TaxID=1460676 RepID=A0ABW4TXU8_9SPHN
MRNAMSVDLEDWFHVGAFENVIPRSDWAGCEDRVARNGDAVLALFDRVGVKSTFFTLGCVAAQHPQLIRKIVAAGHEIASHGWDHKRVFTLTPDEFRADLENARAAIEDAGGVRVTGYRAPSFSIDARTPWAHPVLAEAGYTYSSSVAPVRHDHYGWPESPRYIWRPLADSPLIELPVTTARIGGRTLAAGGGGFFRMLPYAFSRWAIGRANGMEGRPAVFYFHPWEIDPQQPRVANAPLRSKLRHYSRLSAMEGKLERLLKEFAWDRTDHVVARQAATL